MNGVTSSKGALLVGILAICQALGKITLGKVADIPQVNRLQMEQISLLVIAVATCLFPLAKSYAAFLTYAIVQGFFDGGFSVLLGLVTHDIVGKQLMAGAVGSMFAVVAIPLTSGPPVAGLIYDLLGSYDAVYFLASAMVCAGSCLMFVIPWLVDTPNNGKRVTTGDQDDFFPSDGMDGGMSQVTEKKLAELLGKKTAADLLVARNRSLLDHSVDHSRPSSFVLFSIVSDENYRDLSTYTSRMDLNTETPSSPQGSTPGRRQRFFDMDHLRESTFSLYSSARMTLHGSSIQVHSLEPTIQEVAETRTNFHETSLPVLSEVANEASLPVINEVPSEVCVTNISEAIHNVPLPVVIEEPQDTPMLTEIEEVTSVGIEGADCSLVIDDVERKRLSSTSWASAQSSDSLKSSSLESTATNDSGFEENELFVIDPSTDMIEVTKGLSASVAPFVENCDYRTYIANADANDYDDGITQDMNTAGLTCVFADEANRDIILTSSSCSDPSANSADSEKCLEAPSESQSETEYETDFYSLELENNLEQLEGISVSSMHSLDNLDSMPEVAWLGSRLTVETVV